MITLDIICSEYKMINGANRVTEKLVLGYKRFAQNGIKLRYLYTKEGIIDCEKYISPLGDYSENYLKKRTMVEKLKKLPFYKLYPIQAYMQIKTNNLAEISVKRYVKDNNYADFIIFQDVYSAYFMLKKYGVPENTKTVVITHVDTDPMEQMLINRPQLHNTKAEQYIRSRYNYAIENVDKVISICHSSQNYIKRTNNVDAECILNGIEDIPHPMNGKLNNGRVNIVVLGSVIYRKGQDILVDAIAKLDKEYQEKLFLHIIGKGNNFDLIKNSISEKGLTNCCKAYGEIADVSTMLSQMDVMFLPSRSDTVPIAIIEGLRAGLPVFSTSFGEIPYMIEGCGMIIEPTVESVYQALIDLVDNRFDLAGMSNRARKRYQDVFTLNSMIDKYSECIKSLHEKKQTR